MSETKRLLKNTGFLAIGNIGAKIIAFVLLPLYTSILTPQEYGIYDLIVALNAFILPVVTMCIHEAMFRFIIDVGNEGDNYKELVSNAFIVVIANIFLLALIFFGCSHFISFNYWVWLFAYNAVSIFYTYVVFLLRGMGRMKEYATIEGGKNIIQILLNVISIAVLKMGLYGLIVSMCVSEILAVLVVFFRVRFWNQIGIRYFSGRRLKEMLAYALPLVPNSICTQIINISDRVIINSFLGSALNGIYSVAYKFPNIIETVFHFFTNAWGESASRVLHEAKEDVVCFYNKLYKTMNDLIFSVVLLLVSGMPILFRVFVRGEYVSGIKLVPILLFAMYFDCIGKFYAGIFAAFKQTKQMAITAAIAAFINLVVNIVLIQKIGLYAAAISTLLSEIVLCLWRHFYLQKTINIKLEISVIFREIAVACIVVLLFDYDSWVRIIVSIIIATVYAIYTNRAIIMDILKKMKKKFIGISR